MSLILSKISLPNFRDIETDLTTEDLVLNAKGFFKRVVSSIKLRKA